MNHKFEPLGKSVILKFLDKKGIIVESFKLNKTNVFSDKMYTQIIEVLMNNGVNNKEEARKTAGKYFNEAVLGFKENKNIKESGETDVQTIADEIMSKHSFKTVFHSRGETIYTFDNGVWAPTGREVITKLTEEIIGEDCTNHDTSEVIGKIKRQTVINKESFEQVPENLVCLENGVLDLINFTLMKHSPDYNFTTKLPIRFNPKAKSKQCITFIEAMFYEDDVPVIQEWLGYQLTLNYKHKKALLISGEHDTGKTQFLNLLTKFLGERNVAGVSLQEIARHDKFKLASLRNKYANIFDDLKSDDMNCAGGFKMACGSGWISAEKKFGDPFQFKNTAKLTFTCNKIPALHEDQDNAYYLRWILIFADNQIPPEEQNKNLLNEMTTEEELSGLLNWAIDGLKRLNKQNDFSYKKTIEEVKELMRRESNPLIKFCEEFLFVEEGFTIPKEDLYNFYVMWAKQSKKQIMGKTQFSRNLPQYIPEVRASHDSKQRYWVNVKINSDTFDTFIKFFKVGTIYGDKNNMLYIRNKFSGKVSKPSSDKDPCLVRLSVVPKNQVCFTCGNELCWFLDSNNNKYYCERCAKDV